MPHEHTRRQFLARLGAAAGVTLCPEILSATETKIEPAGPQGSRVVIARDEALIPGRPQEHRELLRKLLDASMQKATGAADAAGAWRRIFRPTDRVGIKVNTLGLSTHPVVVDAIVAGLISAGLPPDNILIWDRFDVELAQAGFRLNKSRAGVRCRGTDAERIGTGYQRDIEISGHIGSCFSRIVAQQINTLICVPVLKDHNLAGASLGMKNFYGAIHNPNKYHDHNCDPYVADVVSHRYIAPKWRLTVIDGTRAQYNAGPGTHPGFAWPFGGLLVSTDFVAADAVAADLLEQQRQAKGLKSLAEEGRPPQHIATAGARGLGQADLTKINRIEV
jgi:uncharacterized protein (DUF362 family)